MSYCKRDGKDKSLFLTREDAKDPENIKTLVEDEETYGLIAPDGSINWDCPCLGGMANGPCGSEFKEAFGCFHYSKEEMKGSDCLEQFKVMQECFQKYPEVYSKYGEDEEDEEGNSDKENNEIPKEANNNNDSNNNDDNNNVNDEDK